MDMERLFDECADITKSKGFVVENYPAQVLLMATEVAEALAVVCPEDEQLASLRGMFVSMMNMVEFFRKNHAWDKGWVWDSSAAMNGGKSFPTLKENFLEELADLQIRLASFVAGNGLMEEFMAALTKKMGINQGRPYMHGKQN